MFLAYGIWVLILLCSPALHLVSAATLNLARRQRLQHNLGVFLQHKPSKMTEEEKNAVVDRHNQLRSKRNATYQPCTAADMEAMVWDDELAAEAQSWADGCVGDHADGAGSKFGENLWMSYPAITYTAGELAHGVQEWYDEILDSVWGIDDKRGTGKPGTTVGHYWQVIWAKSNRVGCGVSACDHHFSISGADYGSGVLLVCRYQSPASLKGSGDTNSPPYLFGKPCAACPDHCSDGLCTAPPTRCLDRLGGDNTINIGGRKYDSCKDLVKDYSADSSMPWCTQLAQMMKAEHTCELSCGKCTVPAFVGPEYCDCGDNCTAIAEAAAAKKTAKESKGITKNPQENAVSKGKSESKDSQPVGNSKQDLKAKMREKMREQMKAKMKKNMGGTGTSEGASSRTVSDGSGHHDSDFGGDNGWDDVHGGGDGEIEGGGGWDDWHDGGSGGELGGDGGWDEMPSGGNGEMQGDWDTWESSGGNADAWGSDPWGSGGGTTHKVVSKRQLVSDVSSFKPPQMPEREAPAAPTAAPVKISKREVAAKLP